ncbi:hypothetical protein V2J09_021170 [Rumex salicifolius]
MGWKEIKVTLKRSEDINQNIVKELNILPESKDLMWYWLGCTTPVESEKRRGSLHGKGSTVWVVWRRDQNNISRNVV